MGAPGWGNVANLQTPWQPGQSANARGVTRGYRRVLSACRNASPEAVEVAIKCMRDETASWHERLKAIAFIVDRAYGAPDQKLNIDGSGIALLRVEFIGDPDQSHTVTIAHNPERKGNGRDVIDVPFDEP